MARRTKGPGDLPVTKDDYQKLIDYIDNYDEVIEAVETSEGLRIVLGKRINSYSIITEMLSKGRDSLKFHNLWKTTTEKYIEEKKKSLPYLVLSTKDNRNQSVGRLSKKDYHTTQEKANLPQQKPVSQVNTMTRSRQ